MLNHAPHILHHDPVTSQKNKVKTTPMDAHQALHNDSVASQRKKVETMLMDAYQVLHDDSVASRKEGQDHANEVLLVARQRLPVARVLRRPRNSSKQKARYSNFFAYDKKANY